MELRFYFSMIKRGWWLIAISMLVALNASLIVSYFFTTPMYEVEARFIISPNVELFSREQDLVRSLETLDKRSIVSTYAEVINSAQVYKNTLELLQSDPNDLANYTRAVVVIPDANIIQFYVRGPDPQIAMTLANAVGQNAIGYINNLYQIYEISFIDHAVAPEKPFSPRPMQNAVLSLAIGAVIGIGLAILREQLSATIESLRQRRIIDNESSAFSREYFERTLRTEINKEPYQTLSVGLVALDGIEGFADYISQTFLNTILRNIVEILKDQLRGNDIVARYSKYSFVVLLPTTPGEAAYKTLNRIRKLIAQQPIDLGGDQVVNIEPVVGIASSIDESDTVNKIIERAEQAKNDAMQLDDMIVFKKVDPFLF